MVVVKVLWWSGHIAYCHRPRRQVVGIVLKIRIMPTGRRWRHSGAPAEACRGSEQRANPAAYRSPTLKRMGSVEVVFAGATNRGVQGGIDCALAARL